jgi:hypothetical protein
VYDYSKDSRHTPLDSFIQSEKVTPSSSSSYYAAIIEAFDHDPKEYNTNHGGHQQMRQRTAMPTHKSTIVLYPSGTMPSEI